MTFLDCLNSPKFDFTKNRCVGKMIKFQQSQALTSHFESFWSIVPWSEKYYFFLIFRVMTTLDFNSVPSDPFSMISGGSNTERLRIQTLIESMTNYGVPQKFLFKVEDLLDKYNIPKVVRCLEEVEKLVNYFLNFSKCFFILCWFLFSLWGKLMLFLMCYPATEFIIDISTSEKKCIF